MTEGRRKPNHTRRPDIILFVNGLPLVLLELKNPADVKADLGKAFDQIQTFKEQIPDLFQYNEVLVISDGSEARMGSLSVDAERFINWCTIDGQDLNPLGQFNELETLVRGSLCSCYDRDMRHFEDRFHVSHSLEFMRQPPAQTSMTPARCPRLLEYS